MKEKNKYFVGDGHDEYGGHTNHLYTQVGVSGDMLPQECLEILTN